MDEQKITCTHPDVAPNGLAKDESLPALTLVVKVDAAVTDAPLTNTATVTGKTYDPKPENNTDEDPVTPRPLADLAIEKSQTKPYVVGNQVTYTLAVTNLGPSVSVKDITVVDTLPTGLSIASIDAGPWQCQPTSGETDTLTCVLLAGPAAPEQAPLINVTVDVLESPGPKRSTPPWSRALPGPEPEEQQGRGHGPGGQRGATRHREDHRRQPGHCWSEHRVHHHRVELRPGEGQERRGGR